MSTDQDSERAAFEAEFPLAKALWDDAFGGYTEPMYIYALAAWKAGRRVLASPAPTAEAALSQSGASQQAMPDGWTFDRKGNDTIIVNRPGFGGYVATKNSDSIAVSVLYELASDLLAAAILADRKRRNGGADEVVLPTFTPSDLRLMAGELDAEELRLAQAIAKGVQAKYVRILADRDRRDAPADAKPVASMLGDMQALLTALRFYANGEHFALDPDKFDTVSGELANWQHHKDEATMVEDGSVARAALLGRPVSWLDDDEDATPKPIKGEVVRCFSPKTRASAENAEGLSADAAGWISVDERLPPEGVRVLVYVPTCDLLPIQVDEWNEQREDPTGMCGPTVSTGHAWDEHEFYEVTHWMKLPAPPDAAMQNETQWVRG